MKKICTVSTLSYQINTFLITPLLYLQSHGYEISIVCGKDDEFSKTLNSDTKYYPVQIKRGISIVNALTSIWTLYTLFRKENYHIVQYTTTNAALYSAIAAWMAKVPVRIYKQWGIRYVGFTGLKRHIFRVLEKIICLLSTDIQPDSFGNLDLSVSEGLYPKNKGKVIWNGSASGVNLDKFNIEKKKDWRQEIRAKLMLKPSELVIGFVGRITPEKGINELLSAMKKLLKEEENSKLLIVGWADQADQLDQDLLNWAKNSNHVLFCDSTTKVEQYFSAMDIFVLPSYREGFGSVVIEAEAMELPVIVTDIPGPREAVVSGERGLLVKPKSVESLYEALKKLLNDEPTRIYMGKNGREFVKNNFDQRELFKKMLELYNGYFNKK